ncbi:MAG TPA: PP2C family protein-serine/threonine phosphatase [Spirochaetota bacterium]|jgi:sigma-B regulation protein RsbU (phosphoserine phosphatase)|nr:PP2C family protein-serine/threonine phosphatase [Spirochaetota bacterium]OPZ37276.1 MAG: Phosphoserine phosphatase RsbU [Spirochaetes bacterium ADurb.BinA120]HNU92379.1 PP2C family protein-serine/threonine phosphatase [Spirochaetota bacterium]HPI13200.1 PP2C family protein-serine/threonine phosphatase [Spirochaetota bacterium]HPO46045.1 PP2C family protein-serine/threonine phosphatase [Spirochaetota bacterium]
MTLPDPEILPGLCDRYGIHFIAFDDSFELLGPVPDLSKTLGIDIPESAGLFEVFPELVGRESDLEKILDGTGELSITHILSANGAAYYDLLALPLPNRPRCALLVLHDVTGELEARRLLQQAGHEVSLLSEMLRSKDDNLKALNETTLLYINRLHATEESLMKSREELRRSNERMTRELLMAGKVQRQLVEFDPPGAPWLRTAHTYRPLEEVGGDFMALIEMEDGAFAVCIGDVTGHGVAAALFIALLKSTFRQVLQDYGGSPDVLLERLNDMLIGNLNGNFVTCIYGILAKTEQGAEFVFASGGHPSPVVVRAGGSIDFLQAEGTMLGFRSPLRTRAVTETLLPGDRLYLYTDGLPESGNSQGGMIGFDEGLEEMFQFSRAGTLEETHGRIIEYCDRFRGEEPLHDDITILSFEIVRTS